MRRYSEKNYNFYSYIQLNNTGNSLFLVRRECAECAEQENCTRELGIPQFILTSGFALRAMSSGLVCSSNFRFNCFDKINVEVWDSLTVGAYYRVKQKTKCF